MSIRSTILFAILSTAACLQAQTASNDGDLRQEVTRQLERQRAAYAADLAANRQWMQEMTREYENQNEVILKLRSEIQSLRKEVAAIKAASAQGPDTSALTRLRAELINKLADESEARQAADQRLVKSVSKEIARAAAAAPRPAPKRPAPKPAARTINYTVEPGDTLSAIATAFGTSISRIKSINGLSTDTIRVGQKLNVPAP